MTNYLLTYLRNFSNSNRRLLTRRTISPSFWLNPSNIPFEQVKYDCHSASPSSTRGLREPDLLSSPSSCRVRKARLGSARPDRARASLWPRFPLTSRSSPSRAHPFSATSRDVKRVSDLFFKHLILKSGICLTRPCLIGVFESNYRIQITCEDFMFN